tara:strand:- start:7273 stop:7563 length:291 start_codon:yes stop_codon:yes gene_type:complete
MRKPEMKNLAEAIVDLSMGMRELGELECRKSFASDEAHKEIIEKDIDKIKVRVALAKLSVVQSNTANGQSLLSWDKEAAHKFFSPIKHLLEIHSED